MDHRGRSRGIRHTMLTVQRQRGRPVCPPSTPCPTNCQLCTQAACRLIPRIAMRFLKSAHCEPKNPCDKMLSLCTQACCVKQPPAVHVAAYNAKMLCGQAGPAGMCPMSPLNRHDTTPKKALMYKIWAGPGIEHPRAKNSIAHTLGPAACRLIPRMAMHLVRSTAANNAKMRAG